MRLFKVFVLGLFLTVLACGTSLAGDSISKISLDVKEFSLENRLEAFNQYSTRSLICLLKRNWLLRPHIMLLLR